MKNFFFIIKTTNFRTFFNFTCFNSQLRLHNYVSSRKWSGNNWQSFPLFPCATATLTHFHFTHSMMLSTPISISSLLLSLSSWFFHILNPFQIREYLLKAHLLSLLPPQRHINSRICIYDSAESDGWEGKLTKGNNGKKPKHFVWFFSFPFLHLFQPHPLSRVPETDFCSWKFSRHAHQKYFFHPPTTRLWIWDEISM